MLDIIKTSLYDFKNDIVSCLGIVIIILLSLKKSDNSYMSTYHKNIKHYYTDEECIYSCYFFGKEGGYGGHQCLMDMDERLEEDYRRILKEEERIGLWN